MTEHSFAVTGMTCGHCVAAVSDELHGVAGVSAVRVDLVPGGTSTLTVASDRPLTDGQVAAALDLAGAYQLVPI